MIAVFAAMDAEVRACLGGLSTVRHGTVGGFPSVEGDGALVCQTGIGRRAEGAMVAVLGRYSPACVLSIGVAGGLSPQLVAGEVVLCERVDADSGRNSPGTTVFADPALLEAARKTAQACGLRAHLGRSVTVSTAAWGPEEKSSLRRAGGHDIVEMESYWVGSAARRLGIPFLAVRTVSDGADETLIEIPGLVNEDGTIDYSRLPPYVEQHPEHVPHLARSAESSRRAMESLESFAAAFLPAAMRIADLRPA